MADRHDSAETRAVDRRSFFRLAGAGTLAGAAVVATDGRSAGAVTASGPAAAGYRETDHVRTVYRLARF